MRTPGRPGRQRSGPERPFSSGELSLRAAGLNPRRPCLMESVSGPREPSGLEKEVCLRLGASLLADGPHFRHSSDKRRSSSKNAGYETAVQSASKMRVSPEAARAAIAKAMAMR